MIQAKIEPALLDQPRFSLCILFREDVLTSARVTARIICALFIPVSAHLAIFFSAFSSSCALQSRLDDSLPSLVAFPENRQKNSKDRAGTFACYALVRPRGPAIYDWSIFSAGLADYFSKSQQVRIDDTSKRAYSFSLSLFLSFFWIY